MSSSFAQASPTPREAVSFAEKQRPGVHARAVGSYLPALTRAAFAKYGFSTAALLTDWATVVGADLAKYTEPERLNWPRRPAIIDEPDSEGRGRSGGTLVLRVAAARALDVQYRTRQIVERINAYFGYRAVAELRIVQVPMAPRPQLGVSTTPKPSAPRRVSVELGAITDGRLRSALEHMAHAIVMRATR